MSKVTVGDRKYLNSSLTIEPAYSKYANPNPGADEWALYHHFTHPNSSVLAGQRGRQYLCDGTKEELTKKFPLVEVLDHTTYIDPDEVMPSGSPSDYDEPWDDDTY